MVSIDATQTDSCSGIEFNGAKYMITSLAKLFCDVSVAVVEAVWPAIVFGFFLGMIPGYLLGVFKGPNE